MSDSPEQFTDAEFLAGLQHNVIGWPRWWTWVPLGLALLAWALGVHSARVWGNALWVFVCSALLTAERLELRPWGLRVSSVTGDALLVRWDEVRALRWSTFSLTLVTESRAVRLSRRLLLRPSVRPLIERAVTAVRQPTYRLQLTSAEIASALRLGDDESVAVSQPRAWHRWVFGTALTLAWAMTLTLALMTWPEVSLTSFSYGLAVTALGWMVGMAEDHVPREILAEEHGLRLRWRRRTEFVPWSALTETTKTRVSYDGGHFELQMYRGSAAAHRLLALCRRAVELRSAPEPLTDEAVPPGALSRMRGDEAEAERGISLSTDEPA